LFQFECRNVPMILGALVRRGPPDPADLLTAGLPVRRLGQRGPGCLNPGDEILLINVRGATNNWTNTGHYEFLHVGGVIGDTLYFNTR
jgi:hypothetical protein